MGDRPLNLDRGEGGLWKGTLCLGFDDAAGEKTKTSRSPRDAKKKSDRFLNKAIALLKFLIWSGPTHEERNLHV